MYSFGKLASQKPSSFRVYSFRKLVSQKPSNSRDCTVSANWNHINVLVIVSVDPHQKGLRFDPEKFTTKHDRPLKRQGSVASEPIQGVRSLQSRSQARTPFHQPDLPNVFFNRLVWKQTKLKLYLNIVRKSRQAVLSKIAIDRLSYKRFTLRNSCP